MDQPNDPPIPYFPGHNDSDGRVAVGSGEMEKVCKSCLLVFPNSWTLKKHASRCHHGGDRKFACHVCNSRFTSPAKLKRHALIHTGERPYACRFCRKCFNQTSTLKTHERIHTGECPYKCKTCGRMFRHLSTLRKHRCP